MAWELYFEPLKAWSFGLTVTDVLVVDIFQNYQQLNNIILRLIYMIANLRDPSPPAPGSDGPGYPGLQGPLVLLHRPSGPGLEELLTNYEIYAPYDLTSWLGLGFYWKIW